MSPEPVPAAEKVRLVKQEPFDVVDEVEPTHRCVPIAEFERLQRLQATAAEVIASWDGLSHFTMQEAIDALSRALIDGRDGAQ